VYEFTTELHLSLNIRVLVHPEYTHFKILAGMMNLWTWCHVRGWEKYF
jgi:hypothetical protein